MIYEKKKIYQRDFLFDKTHSMAEVKKIDIFSIIRSRMAYR